MDKEYKLKDLVWLIGGPIVFLGLVFLIGFYNMKLLYVLLMLLSGLFCVWAGIAVIITKKTRSKEEITKLPYMRGKSLAYLFGGAKGVKAQIVGTVMFFIGSALIGFSLLVYLIH